MASTHTQCQMKPIQVMTRAADDLSIQALGNTQPAVLGIEKSWVVEYDTLGLNNSIQEIIRTSEVNQILRIPASSTGQVQYFHGGDAVSEPARADFSMSTVSVTVDASGNGNLYRDGVFAATSSTLTNATGSLTKLQLGASTGVTIPMFGHIKTFSTYDKALTAQEVSLL
jgi:hypothetical protein